MPSNAQVVNKRRNARNSPRPTGLLLGKNVAKDVSHLSNVRMFPGTAAMSLTTKRKTQHSIGKPF